MQQPVHLNHGVGVRLRCKHSHKIGAFGLKNGLIKFFNLKNITKIFFILLINIILGVSNSFIFMITLFSHILNTYFFVVLMYLLKAKQQYQEKNIGQNLVIF